MNFSALKISPGNDDDCRKSCTKYVKTEAFTVLPPLSPQIPPPPPTTNPYRILPPIVSRKKPSFVILQEVGSRPQSREPSPLGRVSPFRGCGFKPSSRETSPSRAAQPPASQNEPVEKLRRSRSRLPVALRGTASRKMSKSVSPVSRKISGIPRPLERRISYSPNRAIQILAEINNYRPKDRSVARSENPPLYSRRAVSQGNLKVCGTRTAEGTRKTPSKPPIPRSAKAQIKSGDATPLSCERPPCGRTKPKMDEGGAKTPGRRIPVSPVRAAKYEPRAKGKENLTHAAKRTPLSPVRGEITAPTPKSPSKTVATRSKENLSPTSRTQSPAKTRSPSKTRNSPTKSAKSPAKTTAKITKKNSTLRTVDLKDSPNELAQAAVTPTNTSNIPSEEAKEERSEKPIPARTVGRKAPTTSNLLSAIKNKNTINDKADDKKELPHTDTSRSLPISVGGAGMTESAVTLIRTTTEPALAPVQPELITEIRSAMSDMRTGDETDTQPAATSSLTASNSTARPTATDSTSHESPPTGEEVQKKYGISSPSTPKTDRKTPAPTQVTAVIETEDRLKPETVASAHHENHNGIDKSSWLNGQSSTATMKKPTAIIGLRPSAEEPFEDKKSAAMEKFRSASMKRGHPVQHVSTITKATTPAAVSSKKSCCRKYFCCFCYKCKLKNGPRMIGGDNANSMKCFSCFGYKGGLKSLMDKLHCCERKMTKADSSAATVSHADSSSISEHGCCAHGKSGVFKCLGILCCLNSSMCLSLRNKFGKLCSGCSKCLCCGVRRQTVITESERRRSTISIARRPRKWTRVFTDFPKLDASFVDHASVMRGAIPVLPVPLAWICLILNVFLPGFGTLSSGVFCLFVGKPRFSINDSLASRFGSLLVNILVAGSQLFTVLFCLVGWGWSVWWGMIMYRMAKKNKRILLAEQVANESRAIAVANANYDAEKGTTA